MNIHVDFVYRRECRGKVRGAALGWGGAVDRARVAALNGRRARGERP